MNLFIKPNEQSRTCSGYAMARKGRMKFNLFIKPNEQSRTCSGYAMAGKGRMKFNLFIKPNEQSHFSVVFLKQFGVTPTEYR